MSPATWSGPTTISKQSDILRTITTAASLSSHSLAHPLHMGSESCLVRIFVIFYWCTQLAAMTLNYS